MKIIVLLLILSIPLGFAIAYGVQMFFEVADWIIDPTLETILISEGCQFELRKFQEAPILYEDEEYKAIKVEKKSN